ncbi:MAG: SBBP repeat-containing protein [Candidatus Aminicenantes bacterium]|nr:SBBP repeat-containing protein [Candidatus Aminicenantes bacterium]
MKKAPFFSSVILLAFITMSSEGPAAGGDSGLRFVNGRTQAGPGIVFSSFLAGRGEDRGCRVAVDRTGAVYVAGFTTSSNFPPVENGQPRQDIFLVKLSPDGKTLAYSAFFPVAAEEEEMTLGLAVDAKGSAYLAGTTFTRLFPVKNAVQKTYGGEGDGFVVKLAPNGKSVVYATFLGGAAEDRCLALCVGADGSAYVAGVTDSRNFPVKKACQETSGGQSDGFLARISPGGDSLVYSTYLGRTRNDRCTALAVDASGAAVAAGRTDGPGFPMVRPIQGFGGGTADAFVVKLAPDGKTLLFSTCLGGRHEDAATALALDARGLVYVGGTTRGGFPIVGGFQTEKNGNMDGFVARLSTDKPRLLYSTYLGGAGDDLIRDIAVTAKGAAYVAGRTDGIGFPVRYALSPYLAGPSDGFLCLIGPAGKGFYASTYIGGLRDDDVRGVAADEAGGIYLTGRTTSVDIPIKSAYQNKHGDKTDGFVMKLHYQKD